ncbi:hypothetical protein AVEN_133766-1 [Araneus ventricosus]|uniref:Uncharacterized protein n=1 Tax=Araneus ventricosus TaxID=182803 RepID=A0A4Y2RWF8_ARAVE|nr:hypothetical protein AVEN_133766-1 [Araneus ventricosus]
MSREIESKRFILSVAGRIFDPIGILGPVVIKLKCLLQEIWTLEVDWDSELPPNLCQKWQQWSSEAEDLTEIRIPRFGTLLRGIRTSPSMHVAVAQQKESLVDINRFSGLKTLLKVTAWVSRFVNNVRNIKKSMNLYFTADEIQNAEYFWIKYVQAEFYSAEISALGSNFEIALK